MSKPNKGFLAWALSTAKELFVEGVEVMTAFQGKGGGVQNEYCEYVRSVMQQPGSLEFLQKVAKSDSVIQEILQDAGIHCPKY